MATVPWQIGVAVGTQTGLGTINATIRDLEQGDGSGTAGALASADGVIAGDPSGGEGESGIEVDFSRSFTEEVDLANYTKQPSSFLKGIVDDLSITWKLKGNGAVAPGATDDSAYAPLAGIDALLQGMALTGAGWGSGDGYIFTPAPLTYLTVKVWVSGLAFVFQDVAADGSVVWTPGGNAIATANLSVGSIAPFAGDWLDFNETFPTFEYGTQTSEAAPTVESVAHAWGSTRGFQTFTLNVANTIEDLPDSNQDDGISKRITDREVTASVTMYADDSDLDFEATELIRSTAPVDLLSFTVGTPAPVASGLKMLGHRVRLTTPEARAIKPRRLGDVLGWDVELTGVSGTANGELELIFL